MIRFKEITMKNFMSYGNKPTVVPLDIQETVLIKGDNRDIGEEGLSTNGVGKSNVMQAVCYALYGEGVNKLKQDDMINFVNEKKLEVSLEFEVNGTPYLIERGRKPNYLRFFQGKEDLTRDSMKNTDTAIVETLGMSIDTFLMSFLMSNSVTPFMAKKPAEQRQFMEDILGLTLLTERANTLKTLRKDVQTELKVVERELENMIRDNEMNQQAVERAEEQSKRFHLDKSSKVLSLKEKLKEAEVDSDIIEKWTRLLEQKEQLEKDIDETQTKINTITKSYNEKEKQINNLGNQIETVQTKAEFYDQEIEKAQNELVKSEELVTELDDEIPKLKELDSKFNEHQELLTKVDRLETTGQELLDRIMKTEKTMEKEKAEIDHLEDESCPYCHQHYNTDESQDKLKKLRVEYKENENLLKDLEHESETVANQIDELDEANAKIPEEVKNFDPATLRKKQNEHERLQTSCEQLKDKLAQLDQQKADAATMDVSELQEQLSEAQQALQELEDQFVPLDEKLQAKEEDLKEVKERLKKDNIATMNDVRSRQKEAENIQSQLEEVQNSTDPYEGQIRDLNQRFKDVGAKEQEQKSLETDERHYGYLIQLLTSSKSFIRQGIIDQYVGFLNKKINEYTQKLGLPHISEINSDLTVDIEYMRKSVSYYNMSAGERLRLDVGTSLAMRELLGKLGVKSNLLMVDEVLDGAIDASGLKQMYSMMKGYCEHVMLISHRDDFQSMVDRVVTVRKQNGFSVYDAK